MEITEVRVRLVERKQDRLRAFCTVTFDDEFVIRDVKVIQGDRGLFVAMPSRKLTDRCPSCRTKNQLRARYCGECGHSLRENRAQLDERGRPRLYVDIAHPINPEARERLEQAVLAAFREEEQRAAEPGYQPQRLYEEEAEEGEEVEELVELTELEEAVGPAAAPEEVEAGAEREPEQQPEGPPSRPSPAAAGEEARQGEHRFGEGIFEEDEAPGEGGS